MAEKNKKGERKRRLTKKQRKLIDAIEKDPNGTLNELGQKADYNNPANVNRALKSEAVQQTLRAEMEANPALCRKARLKKLAEGMEAEKTTFFQFNGQVTEQRDCVDYPTRKSYLELAGKLCGDLVEKHEHKFDGPMPFKLEYSDEKGETPLLPKPGDKGKS